MSAILRKALEDIVVRCREGDSRTNWLPIIARIANEAIAADARQLPNLRAILRDTLARYDAVIVLDPAKGYHYGSGPSPDFIADGIAARLADD